MDAKVVGQAFRYVERGQNKNLADKLARCPGLVSAVDSLGYSLLQRAVGGANWEAFDILVARGADPNFSKGHNGASAMAMAVANRDREGVERLLAVGADIDARDAFGNEPIVGVLSEQTSIRPEEDEDFFFFMIERGASLASAGNMLRLAAARGLLRVARHLLDNALAGYPDPAPGESPAPEARPAPDAAQPAGMDGYLDSLLDRMKRKMPEGSYNPIADSLEATRENLRRVAQGREPCAPPALHMAVRGERVRMAEFLLERGAARGNGGEDGRKALMIALEERVPALARVLVDAGVSTEAGVYAPGWARAEPEGSALLAAERVLAAEPELAGGDDPARLIAALAGDLPSYPRETWPLIAAVPAVRRRFLDALRRGPVVPPRDGRDAGAAPARQVRVGLPTKVGMMDEMTEARDARVDLLLARGTCPARDDRPLAEVFAELLSRMADLDARLPEVFLPGLSEGRLASIGERENGVPPVVAGLYALRNGMAVDAEGIFRQYVFRGLEEALAINDMKRESTAPYFFTVMEDVFGAAVEVDTRDDAHRGLVYEVDEHDFVNVTVYPSLSAFFAAAAACFAGGMFRVLPGSGARPDRVSGDYLRIDACFAEYALSMPGPKAVVSAGNASAVDEYDETGFDYCFDLPDMERRR